MTDDQIDLARKHAMIRFAAGVTIAFVLSEAMGWFPSFMPAVLLVVLLTNLPGAPPFKVGLLLFVVMTLAANLAYVIPYLLRGTPVVMVGVIGLVIFFALLASARGVAKLPALLLLICMAVIPVIVMVAPAQASALRLAMGRSMAIAILVLWLVYALWPRLLPPAAPAAAPPVVSPVRKAVGGTLVVMPMMIAYLMYGIADALPVLITTVMLILNFDARRGAIQGVAFMIGNLVGGAIGTFAFFAVTVAPSLVTLALLVFLIGMRMAARIDQGGAVRAVAIITCNTTLVILSIALGSPSTNASLLATRLFQFALACLFAVGMMSLIWGMARHDKPALAESNA